MENKYTIAHGTFIEVGNELSHRKTKRRYERKTNKNFKYVAKIDIGKTTRYFYTKDEYDAYLNGKKNTESKDVSKTKKTSDKSKSKKTGITKVLEKVLDRSTVGRYVKLGMRIVDQIVIKTENKKKEEAKRKAEEEAKRKAKEEAKRKAEEEAKRKADEEYERRVAEEEAEAKKLTAEADAISEANSPKSWDELKHKDHEYTKDEDQAIINPNYISSEEGQHLVDSMTEEENEEMQRLVDTHGIFPWEYTINCQSCTLAYDLRQRGYDVEAAPYDDDETWQADFEGISTWYEDVTIDDWDRFVLPSKSESVTTPQKEMYDKVSDKFDEMPDGSYGQFCVDWFFGGGHSMAWEKENGNVTIRDCQTNEKYSFNEIHLDVSLYNSVSEVYVLRTDDKKITNEALKRVRNADHVEEIDKYIQKMREKYGTGKE